MSRDAHLNAYYRTTLFREHPDASAQHRYSHPYAEAFGDGSGPVDGLGNAVAAFSEFSEFSSAATEA
jgi:hypothetical protein